MPTKWSLLDCSTVPSQLSARWAAALLLHFMEECPSQIHLFCVELPRFCLEFWAQTNPLGVVSPEDQAMRKVPNLGVFWNIFQSTKSFQSQTSKWPTRCSSTWFWDSLSQGASPVSKINRSQTIYVWYINRKTQKMIQLHVGQYTIDCLVKNTLVVFTFRWHPPAPILCPASEDFSQQLMSEPQSGRKQDRGNGQWPPLQKRQAVR